MAGSEPPKTSSQEMLEKALKARELFLKEQPHLQAFQDEIDRTLEKTVGLENRMAVLAFMIEKKLYELRDAFVKLNSSALKIQGVLNKAKVENGNKALDYSKKSDGYFN